MKEKEIWLDSEEIKQLLEGGLFWKDIESKIALGDNEGFKRHINKEDVDIDNIIWEPIVNNSSPQTGQGNHEEGDSEQIRAILLGEEDRKQVNHAETNPAAEVSTAKQIDFSHAQEQELASLPHAAAEEDDELKDDELISKDDELISKDDELIGEEDSEVNADEKDVFSSIMLEQKSNNSQSTDMKIMIGDDDKHLDEDFYEELEKEEGSFGGLKLVALLLITAAVTFGFWYYFLSR